jgi:subtilisin family serine protease
MTRVAAIIAGRSPLAPRGIAPGSRIVQVSIAMPAYDNLETAARVAKAIECAVTDGRADVINLSLSEPRRQSYLRTYLDHLVTTYGVFVAVAAGNAVYGTCPDGEPVSPATAWNVLTVGGTDDRGTATHRDDRLWTENGRNAVCTDDPRGQNGDEDRRIKPELSAIARNISVAGYPPSSGTSYATPMVSGAAATLIGRDPVLAAQPHVVKAILVASSRAHRTPKAGGGLSTDREGAGTLSVDWAHAIVTGSRGRLHDTGGHGERVVTSSATLAAASALAVTTVLPLATAGCRTGSDATFTFTGHAGRAMRVAIVWNAHARRPSLGSRTVDRRKSDLDLVVRAPGGSVIRGDATSRTRLDASNLEWLDFTAPTDGRYTATIDVSRWDCDLVREPVGYAWVALPD